MGALGIAPSEFWRMTPLDFWLVHDGRVRQNQAGRGSCKMTLDEYNDLADKVEAIIIEKGLEPDA